jgi:hypothetical protein
MPRPRPAFDAQAPLLVLAGVGQLDRRVAHPSPQTTDCLGEDLAQAAIERLHHQSDAAALASAQRGIF